MQPSELGESYDAIAPRWLDPGLEMNGMRQHEQALRFRGGGGVALDVGCGCSGRFARLLVAQGYEVEGMDVSAEMVALARVRNPGATFFQADVCEWVPDKRYDFITAWDSIWHVPLERSEGVLRKLGVCAGIWSMISGRRSMFSLWRRRGDKRCSGGRGLGALSLPWTFRNCG